MGLFSWIWKCQGKFQGKFQGKYKSLFCNKNYSSKIDEELRNRFKNIFKFSNNDINRFTLLLRRGVYPYEYIDDWERFNKTKLPGK